MPCKEFRQITPETNQKAHGIIESGQNALKAVKCNLLFKEEIVMIKKKFIREYAEEKKSNFDEMRRSIQVFQPENAVFEVRIIPTNGNFSKHCYVKNNEDGLNAFFKELEKHNMTKMPLYMTLQAVNQEAECLDSHEITSNAGYVKDKDITHYQWIYVDIDPDHPAGTQATNEEMLQAKNVSEQVKIYLEEKGFPKPVYAFTGNGYSLNYPTRISNTKENAKLVNSFLKALKMKYPEIDTSVSNPARISKMIGCLSCKGKDTFERPYRVSKLLDVPKIENYVTEAQLQTIVDELTPVQNPVKTSKKIKKPSQKKKSIRIRNVGEWLESYNISYRLTEDEYDNKPVRKFELEDCPFNEHDNHYCSAVIQFDNGNAIFKCFHNHCQDNTIYDMLEKYPLKNQIPFILGEDKITQIYNETVSDCQLIISDDNQYYVLANKNEVVHYESSEFGDYIVKQAQKINLIPSKNTIATVRTNINALYGEYAHHASVAERIAFKNNTLYYALDKNHSVKISDGNVSIEDKLCDNLYFHYSSAFVSQCEPNLNTPATELPELIKQTFNINEEHLLSFLAELVCFYMPHINTPLLVLSGGQGTSKSTTSRKIKDLVDPSAVDIETLPEKIDSLYTVLSGSYLTAFDNIDKITDEYSNVFCVACTGGTTSKRKLFTDNEKVQIKLHTKIILNGIGDIISKNDLAERTNIIYLDAIQKRRTETQVWKEFDELKPEILGAIFNCIKEGLGYVDEMNHSIQELPRMADFCVYGACFIKAMGLDWKEFVQQYTNTTTGLIAEQTQQDEFTMILQKFLAEQNNQWNGEPKTLLEELKKTALAYHLTLKQNQPNTLARKLNQSSVSLKAVGITVTASRGKKRQITLSQDADKIQ